MIITSTPYRISLFGGGTDYPAWTRENGGAVLSTSINKYCYITCRHLPPFFQHTTRVVWSKIETVQQVDEIVHPSARETLKFMGFSKGLEIHHDGDLPARTGIGSSSSFTVGLLNALYALKGQMVSKEKLAKEAIHIEQDILKENVGSQDQVAVAYGGFNRIQFMKNGDFRVTPVIIPKERLQLLQDHLLLIFSGFSRYASEIAGEQIQKTVERKNQLKTMQEMVEEALKILNSRGDLCQLGQLLHESWMLKKSITDKISTGLINDIYNEARKAGAMGGKLCGAGGGGFLLLFVKPPQQRQLLKKLDKFLNVPFKFENKGSHVTFFQANGLWE